MAYSLDTKFNMIFSSLGVTNLKYRDKMYNLPICEIGEELKEIQYYLGNKNLNLVVIESMSLAIFLTDYSIYKLPYFRTITNTKLNTSIKYFHTRGLHVTKKKDKYSGCKIYCIDREWCTYNWDYNRIVNINVWINSLPHADEKVDLYQEVNTTPYTIQKLYKLVDLEFIKSMGCHLDNIEGEI